MFSLDNWPLTKDKVIQGKFWVLLMLFLNMLILFWNS